MVDAGFDEAMRMRRKIMLALGKTLQKSPADFSVELIFTLSERAAPSPRGTHSAAACFHLYFWRVLIDTNERNSNGLLAK